MNYVPKCKEHLADIKYKRKTITLTRVNNKESLQINFNVTKITYSSKFIFLPVSLQFIEIFIRKETIYLRNGSFEIPVGNGHRVFLNMHSKTGKQHFTFF